MLYAALFGARLDGGPYTFFNGKIDEIKVYDHELNAGE